MNLFLKLELMNTVLTLTPYAFKLQAARLQVCYKAAQHHL